MPEAPFRNPILGPRTPPMTTGPVGPYSGQDPYPPPLFHPPPERPALPIGPRVPPMSTMPVVPEEAYQPAFHPPPMREQPLIPRTPPMGTGPIFRPPRGPIDDVGLWQASLRRLLEQRY